VTSGIRIGTAAVTSRGMKEKDMLKIFSFIDKVIMNFENEKIISGVKAQVNTFMKKFPLY
jgi:glycine hydroxymethyltransferase